MTDPVIMSQPIISKATILERAKFSDRFFAMFIDCMIIYIPLGLMQILSMSFFPSLLLRNLISFLIFLFGVLSYFAVVAYSRNGQTWGMSRNKLKVLDLEGNDLTISRFLFREFMARGLPIILSLFSGVLSTLWLFTYLMALRKDRRALHDIVANTQVVKIK